MARAILRLTRLDERIAPSTVATATPITPPIAPAVVVSRPSQPSSISAPTPAPVPAPVLAHPVAGMGTGKYICSLTAGGVPTGFHFVGMMDTKGMGRVMVQASIYGVGFRSTPAAGRIVLSNAKGSVTLEVIAGPQPRLSRLPDWFRYKVSKATGAYKNMTDSGTLRLTRFIDAVPMINGIRYAETGKFRLII